MKIAAKGNVDHVKKWSDKIEARIDEAEEDVTRIREWAETMKKEESQKLWDEELKYEQKLFETRLQFQSELKEAGKLQQAQGSGSGDVVAGLQAKLPKLVITKFNGTFKYWPRFWGQFCEAIDKSNIAGVTKFSYLRELLAPKVRASIEALPFTPEGYLRALSILKDKYGKESEIVKAYNKEIWELPVISGVNAKK